MPVSLYFSNVFHFITVNHNWELMRNNIQKHIESLNSGYRCQLKDKKVEYINAYGKFIGKNKILVDKTSITVTG